MRLLSVSSFLIDLSRASAPLFRGFPRAASRLTEWSAAAAAAISGRDKARLMQTAFALRATRMYSDALLARLARLPAAQFAEGRLIRFGSVDHLRSIQGEIAGIGLEPVLQAKAQNCGLILGCTHIGTFYHALIQAGRLGSDLMVVTGNQHHAPETVKRLIELSGVNIRVIGAATGATVAIARQLHRGGVVATMLDLYVESTLAIAAPLFGRPAATPAGIYQLAIATGAPIVPVCVVTDAAGRKSVEIDSVVGPRSTPLDFAAAINERIEAMVRRHADTWGAWAALPYRWRKAAGWG